MEMQRRHSAADLVLRARPYVCGVTYVDATYVVYYVLWYNLCGAC